MYSYSYSTSRCILYKNFLIFFMFFIEKNSYTFLRYNSSVFCSGRNCPFKPENLGFKASSFQF